MKEKTSEMKKKKRWTGELKIVVVGAGLGGMALARLTDLLEARFSWIDCYCICFSLLVPSCAVMIYTWIRLHDRWMEKKTLQSGQPVAGEGTIPPYVNLKTSNMKKKPISKWKQTYAIAICSLIVMAAPLKPLLGMFPVGTAIRIWIFVALLSGSVYAYVMIRLHDRRIENEKREQENERAGDPPSHQPEA
jgi:hypothetical protein